MTPQLKSRINQIVAPNVFELAAKRNAKFGKLNLASGFDLVAQIRQSEQRGDIRRRFALLVGGQP